MQVHQFVHTLNYGDAISGEALAIRRILQSTGISSEIYSVHAHEKLKDVAIDFREFDSMYQQALTDSEDVLIILHYSIASPLNDLFKTLENATRAIIYHNLTPVRWFLNHNSRVVADLRRGIAELPELANIADIVLADSDYNRQELVGYGATSAEVLPLLLDNEKWKIDANPGICGVLNGHGGKNFLHVGRLAPNKCIEDIIKAFYFYHHKINQDSRLWLVGMDIDTEIYSFELRRLVTELRLRDAVTFVGAVSDDELKAFYQESDGYLCMSEHEGFCVPLLEAMHFGLPIIAFDACAVGETLADAGILVAEKQPALIAELMELVVTDNELIEVLRAKGRIRVNEFDSEQFARQLREKLLNRLSEFSSVANKSAVGASG